MKHILQMAANEVTNEYRDSTVFGGFSDYVCAWAEEQGQEEIAALAKKYAATKRTERGPVLEQLQAALLALKEAQK